MQNLNHNIKNQAFQPIYLLYGEETFLKKSYKQRLKTAIIDEDSMNYSYFEGRGINIAEVTALSDTLPFFAERRLIIIENSGFFKNAANELVDYLSEKPVSTYFVFVESEVDKRGRMYKKVKELGYIAEMTRQSTAQLSKWVLGILSKEGKKITSSTMDLLLSKTGDDMERIRMEVEKLVCYTMNTDVITSKDVELICTSQISNKIFDMISAVANKNIKLAMNYYEDLLALKEPPMRILFLMTRQFNQLLQVNELLAKGADKSGISAKLKMQPFVVNKWMTQTRSFTKKQLGDYVTACIEFEESVKTGRLTDTLAVELLIAMGTQINK